MVQLNPVLVVVTREHAENMLETVEQFTAAHEEKKNTPRLQLGRKCVEQKVVLINQLCGSIALVKTGQADVSQIKGQRSGGCALR